MVRMKRFFALLIAALLVTTVLRTCLAQPMQEARATEASAPTEQTTQAPEALECTTTPENMGSLAATETPEPTVSAEETALPTQESTPDVEETTTPNVDFETTPAPSQTTDAEPQAPSAWEGLVSIPAGTTLYLDEHLQTPACVLAYDGIAYQMPTTEPQEAVKIIYTTDGLTPIEGYALQAQLTPLCTPQPSETPNSETSLLYRGCALNAIVTVSEQYESTPAPATPTPEPYEMETYGLPGMQPGYELSAQELAAKERLALNGVVEQLSALQPGIGYEEGCILLQADTEEYARQVATSYNATLTTYAYGVAVLMLNDATVKTAITAAADPLARLVAVEPNYYHSLDVQASSGVPPMHSSTTALLSVPTANEWADYQQGDPLLANPDSVSYQYMHEAVNTWAAWGLTTGDPAVRVAILDTGVRATHEEFGDRVIGLTTVNPSVQSTEDANGHGTHVAGIIGATMGNGCGGAGIAPNVTLLSYSITNPQGAISSSSIVYGLGAACANDAWVICICVATHAYSETESKAVKACIDLGIPVIASTGNNGGMMHAYPAHYADVISVAATDQSGMRAPYSNYGSATLCAPGSHILSTSNQGDGDYAAISGTTMSAAVVAGTCALYYSAIGTQDVNGDGNTDRADVALLTKRLCASCTQVAGGAKGMGAGIINVGKLFSTLVQKPRMTLLDKSGTALQSTAAVPTSATVRITGQFGNDYIVYTTDGSTPAVANGSITNGHGGDQEVVLSLAHYPAGKVTVKALSVSAYGKASAVSTLTFTIDNRDVSAVQSIEFQEKSLVVCAGNSTTLLATVTPATKSLKPSWNIISGGEYATLNAKTGKLSVLKTAPAFSTVTVQALLGNVVQKADVQILPRIKSLSGVVASTPDYAVKGKTLTAYAGASETTDISLSLTFEDGTTAIPQQSYIQAIVAKPAFAQATVEDGLVRLRGLRTGKTNVTLIPANNTSKKLSFTLWVKQRVGSICLPGEGSSSIAVGKSRTLQATVLPSNATDKKLEWSIDGDVPDGITLKKNRLTCAKTAKEGDVFTLRCASATDPSRYATQTVTICSPTLSLRIHTDDPKATYSSKGVLKEAVLYTIPLDNTGYDHIADTPVDEAKIQLDAHGTTATVLWSSSNTRIATVDANGQVSAVGTGTATITCSAADGSNKKASVKVRVIVPVGSLRLSAGTQSTSISDALGETPVLAMGKALKLYAAYGNAYGTPSVRKAEWRVADVYYLNEYEYEYTHITSDALADGAVSINASTGQLRVKPYQGLSGYYVDVQASSADKSCESPLYTVYVQPQTTTLASMKGVYTLLDTETARTHEQTYASTLTLAPSQTGVLSFYTDSAIDNYTITSSNPAVAAPYRTGSTDAMATQNDRYRVMITKKGSTTRYRLVEMGVVATRPGTAKITVRTNDGTNKSCTFTVRVVK